MYKIYINDRPLILAEPAEQLPWLASAPHLDTQYLGKPKHLLPYIDLMEKSPRYEAVVLRHTPSEQLWADFRSLFQLIEAAGGVVHAEETPTRILLIFRRGMWDLPKGKIDSGESPQQAALREVEEETGLHCRIQTPLISTWHTYRSARKRILKKTWWFRMSAPEQAPVLQREEEIESARWMNVHTAYHTLEPMWQSIRNVLKVDLKKGL